MSVPDRKNWIRSNESEIKRGNYRPALGIIKVVLASEFMPSVMQTAKKVLSHIKPWPSPDSNPDYDFGFKSRNNAPAFYMGPLLELMPRHNSLPFFRIKYARHVFAEGTAKGLQALLGFSTGQSAAQFLYDLRQEDASDLPRLLSMARNRKNIRNYDFRRFEVNDLLLKYRALLQALRTNPNDQ